MLNNFSTELRTASLCIYRPLHKPLCCTAIVKELFTLSKYFYHYVTYHEIVVNIVSSFGSSEKCTLACRTYTCEEKSFPSPLVKEMAITQPSLVLFKSVNAILFSMWFQFKCYMKDHMGTKWLLSQRIAWLNSYKKGRWWFITLP